MYIAEEENAPIPGELRSRVLIKFACAGCNACYVSETIRQFSTQVKGFLASKRASRICKTLNVVALCVQQIVSMFWITAQLAYPGDLTVNN